MQKSVARLSVKKGACAFVVALSDSVTRPGAQASVPWRKEIAEKK